MREVQESELGELAEGGGDGVGEVEVAEAEEGEVLELAEGSGDRAGDVGEAIQVDHLQVREITNGGGDLARERAVEDGELDNAVGGVVAGDVVPVAAVGVSGPRGQHVRVVESLLDGQEDLLVRRVTELGKGWRYQEVAEEKREQES